MGCTVSKLDNDDTVQRCRERRHLMKEAVYARHHLAAAHFDYCTSLRLTGSALVAFASGEPLPVSDHTPAVLLRTPTPTSATKPPPSRHHSPNYYPSPSPSVRPPPPPPPMSTTSSYHKPPPPPPRRRKPIKLPHILSDSSFSSSPPPNHNFTYNARANSTYSSTPSQTSSSVWNWDNFYPPPSPPDSEFFHKLHNSNKSETRPENPNSDDDKQFDDVASNYSSNSRYSGNNHARNQTPNKPAALMRKTQNSKKWGSSEEEEEAEREEVECSEWGDHDNYTSTSSSSDEEGDLRSRSDFTTRPDKFGSVKNDGDAKTNVNLNAKFSSISEKLSSEEDEDGKSSVNWGNGNSEGVNSESRIVVRHRDLSEIVGALSEYFDKAASAGDQVSEILEAGPAQLDRSFKQLRKTIYHSSGMLSNLSSSWTSKPPLAVKYRLEQSGDTKGTLCSTLERILAWENKLYQEVKAREGVKLENEKKLSALQSQEYRGDDEAKVDKTKASIKRLQSLQLVTSQAVSTTSFAIIGLRDSDLVPQLVELCHGFMYMWRSMNRFHHLQNDVVQQVRGLVCPTTKSSSTSDLHRQATRDLESAVATWHSSFCRTIKFHRDFIRSLHGWLKLTVVPVNSTESTRTERSQVTESVFAFLDEWKLVLDRVPDTVASEAMKSFENVVHSISSKQTEEIKIKRRAESAARDLEKRASSLRNIERKYYQSYSMVGVGPPPDVGPAVLDGRDPLAEKKAEMVMWRRRVEEEMVKHTKAVEVTRAMTLNNIQTGLPGVFQAVTGFSALITEALDSVCTTSYAI
ncbi:hypothetical protein ABFS83_14G151000 [Erythranthe nasuta]